MKRATLILLAAIGAGVALGPGPAGAGTENDTVVTSHPGQGGGYVLDVTATPGQRNFFNVDDGAGSPAIVIRDTGPGITDESPKCTQESPTEVQCKPQGLRRLNVDTGDMGDVSRSVSASTFNSFKLGPGADEATVSGRATVKGEGDDDTLQGRRGNQRLLGGDGPDTITGGSGNKDYCDGEGGDDSGGDGCEKIVSL
ncbi:MAG: hypothetical protein QOI31_2645 [Solirubrobacterales bacterium]|jgi:Ca2+-binding RTX toxin-like protein|nr:hypothetical protein [Solirubrobacterales bacterium]